MSQPNLTIQVLSLEILILFVAVLVYVPCGSRYIPDSGFYKAFLFKIIVKKLLLFFYHENLYLSFTGIFVLLMCIFPLDNLCSSLIQAISYTD